jgi:GGDEF domain-containing protein
MAEPDRMLNVDPLTGPLNRAAATSGLSQMCDAGGGAVLVIDMDGLKAINDRTDMQRATRRCGRWRAGCGWGSDHKIS